MVSYPKAIREETRFLLWLGICDKNEMARSFVYLCAPLSPPAPLLPPPFLRYKYLDFTVKGTRF